MNLSEILMEETEAMLELLKQQKQIIEDIEKTLTKAELAFKGIK